MGCPKSRSTTNTCRSSEFGARDCAILTKPDHERGELAVRLIGARDGVSDIDVQSGPERLPYARQVTFDRHDLRPERVDQGRRVLTRAIGTIKTQ